MINHTQSGQKLFSERRFHESLHVFKHALRESGNSDYGAAVGAAKAAGALRHYEKSLKLYRVASSISPANQTPLVEMANLCYRMKEFDNALIHLQRALSLGSISNGATILMLRCLAEVSDFSSIEKICHERLEQKDLDARQKYAWTVRKIRALFFQGKRDEAAALVDLLKKSCVESTSKYFDSKAGLDGGIDVVLNCYRRPREVEFLNWWLKYQSVEVNKVWVWNNFGGDEYPQSRFSESTNAIHDENHKFYGRFSFGLLSSAKYLAFFDDDTVPGLDWLHNCWQHFATNPGVYGTVGVNLNNSGQYSPNTRFGWVIGDSETCETVDLAGHAWFFPRDWLRYFWFEQPSTFETGEDMHLSFSVQKHLSLPTIVPPHPKDCPGLWGSLLGNELGADLGSSSMQKAGNHYHQRDYCVKNLESRGWRLVKDGG